MALKLFGSKMGQSVRIKEHGYKTWRAFVEAHPDRYLLTGAGDARHIHRRP
jgi:hypothetical protein